jgi:hypothetical protein
MAYNVSTVKEDKRMSKEITYRGMKCKPLEPKLTSVRLELENGSYFVVPVFGGLCRPDSSRYSCGKNRKLAERFMDAILAGVVLTDLSFEEDVNGDSYASFGLSVRMRALS